MSTDRKRILFVCMGNICRSPAADIIFRHLVDKVGLSDQIDVDSAGTIGYHTGKGPDPRMAKTLKSRGYTISGKARQVEEADLDSFDLILTMDEENLVNVRDLARTPEQLERIKPFVSFCSASVPRIPDPYYGGDDGFETVADLLEDGCANLLNSLRE